MDLETISLARTTPHLIFKILRMNQNSLSLLSGHDQVIQIFAKEFNIPSEVTFQVLSKLAIPNLHKILGATLEQLIPYVRITGFDKFKSQLMKNGGTYLKMMDLKHISITNITGIYATRYIWNVSLNASKKRRLIV